MNDTTSHFPTPRASVFDVSREKYVAVMYGDGAVERAQDFISTLPADAVERGEYDLSVSDDKCGVCGEFFSSEARVHTDAGWACPQCGGDPKEQ